MTRVTVRCTRCLPSLGCGTGECRDWLGKPMWSEAAGTATAVVPQRACAQFCQLRAPSASATLVSGLRIHSSGLCCSAEVKGWYKEYGKTIRIARGFSWFADGISEIPPFINLWGGVFFRFFFFFFFRNGDYLKKNAKVKTCYILNYLIIQSNICFIFSLAAGLNLSCIQLLMGRELLLGKSRAVCSQLLKEKKKRIKLVHLQGCIHLLALFITCKSLSQGACFLHVPPVCAYIAWNGLCSCHQFKQETLSACRWMLLEWHFPMGVWKIAVCLCGVQVQTEI